MFILTGVALCWCCRRFKRAATAVHDEPENDIHEAETGMDPKPELDGSIAIQGYVMPKTELATESNSHELEPAIAPITVLEGRMELDATRPAASG
jgi:hypothetical protein